MKSTTKDTVYGGIVRIYNDLPNAYKRNEKDSDQLFVSLVETAFKTIENWEQNLIQNHIHMFSDEADPEEDDTP